MTPAGAVLAALHATWPAAETTALGPWTIRRGAGGGNRVSAATLDGAFAAGAIDRAEAAMRALGQAPLFMIRDGEDDLDAALAERGYLVRDPTVLMRADLPALDLPVPPRLAAIPAWPPIAIQRQLWREGGIGPARLAVMERAAPPRITFLGRLGDRTAGTVFAACHGGVVMAHALHVDSRHRRGGAARHLVSAVAHWGVAQGAGTLAVAVTRANTAARGLYASLGLTDVGQYHYRALPTEGPA